MTKQQKIKRLLKVCGIMPGQTWRDKQTGRFNVSTSWRSEATFAELARFIDSLCLDPSDVIVRGVSSDSQAVVLSLPMTVLEDV